MLWASATRRFASDTRRAISSVIRGDPEEGDPVAGVGPLDTLAERAPSKADAIFGTGVLIDGPVQPSVLFLKTASFAAISARFCKMISADVCWNEVSLLCTSAIFEMHVQLQRALNRWWRSEVKRGYRNMLERSWERLIHLQRKKDRLTSLMGV